MPFNSSRKPAVHRKARHKPRQQVQGSAERPRGTEGIVLEALPAANFRVRISQDQEIIGYLAGKMRIHYIKVLPGDRVLVELSPDGKRGRITRRL